MKQSFWNKKIPTILGILVITIGVGVTTFLANQSTLFKSNASLSNQPKNIRITNITDTSFTVSYSTDKQVSGSLNYGKDQSLGQSALDDRDQQSGNLANYNAHNITIQRLSQSTQYFFTITSGQDSFLNNNQPFAITTGPILSNPPDQSPMTGKIILPDGTAPAETLVYVTMDGAQVISTLVKSDGSYILPLNSLRTGDNSAYYTFPKNASIKILATGNLLSSNASLSFNQIHPVPTITLSKNYDFKTGELPITIPVSLESFPSFESTASAKAAVEILTPKENQSFTDQQPLFKGKGLPEQDVEIVIHSDTQIQTTVTTDANGNWNYRPANPLSPGNHTITITTKNSVGILQTISQSFVVYAAGQQTNPPAPSATPTPGSNAATISPTPKITPTLTPSPTATPTPTVTTVPFETASPTALLSQTQTKGGTVISPTPTEKLLPPTGNPSIITFGIAGAIITLIGSLLFLLSRGSVSAL
jgi:hypothetical protein